MSVFKDTRVTELPATQIDNDPKREMETDMTRERITAALAFFVGGMAIFWNATAGAAEKLTADEIVARMDKTISGAVDQTMIITMNILNERGETKQYDFWIKQLGDAKRMVRFTSGEMKDMAMLTESRNRVHLYLPGFKRVRRIAAHAMGQTMAGSDFTNDDMSSTAWAQICTPEILSEDETAWQIKCTPKPEEKAPYKYVVFTVQKDGYFQSSVMYYNEKNEAYKQMRSTDMKDWGNGVTRYKTVTMEDLKTGHKTILDIREYKVNEGLKESEFTVRELTWGK